MADREIKVSIVGDASDLQRAFGKASTSASKFNARLGVASDGFRRFAKSATAAAALAAGAFTLVVGKGVAAASDLNEQINKSEVVFGDSAAAIQAWAKTTADALGLSQRQALEAAGGFGQMLETAGLTEQQAAQFSKRLVELGADMASFNNIDPTEALQKLKSGLAGEAEPLRQVGVLLSEARVRQEAYRLGLAATGDELTEQQKVQARYSLILKDTAKQQGDFARTSDSFANAQRRVRANIENIAASLGSVFLPAVAGVTDKIADFLGDLGEAQTVRAKLEVVFDTGRSIVEQGIQVADDIRQQIGDALAAIDWREAGRRVGDGLTDALSALSRTIEQVDWGQVGQAVVRGISDFLKGVDWVQVLKVTGTLIVKAIIALDRLLFAAAKELGRQILLGIQAGVRALAGLVVTELRKLPQQFAQVGQFFANQAVGLGEAIVEGIGRGIDSAKNFVLRKLLEFVNRVLGVTGFLGRFDPFKGVREKVQARLKEMEGDARTSSGNIQKSINGVKGKDVAIRVSENGVSETQRAIDGIKGKDVFVNIKARIDSTLARLGGLAVGTADAAATAGDNSVAQGAVNAAKQQAEAEKKAAAAAAKAREDAAKAAKAAAARAAKAKEAAIEAFASLMDSLSLAREKAAIRKGFGDDLRVLNQQLAAIRAEMKVEGRTVELLRQQFEVEQEIAAVQKQIAEQRQAARKSRQFVALGLTAEGEERVAGVGALLKRLGTLKEQVKGTFLDTDKTRAQFARIAKVLAEGPKKVGRDVRSAIQQMLADISGALKQGEGTKGPLTKARKLNINQLLDVPGLSAAQVKELRAKLSRATTTNVVGGGAFGVPVPVGAAAGAGFGATPPIHITLEVDGREMSNVVVRHGQRKSQQNAASRRGVRPGVKTGLG